MIGSLPWRRGQFLAYVLSFVLFGNPDAGTGSIYSDGFVLTVNPNTKGVPQCQNRGVALQVGDRKTSRSSSNDNTVEETASSLLTPKQVRAVRKEMLRRRASQTIDTIYWTDDPDMVEDSSHQSATVDKRRQIADLLLNRNFVQVRGVVSKDLPSDTRIIRNAAERLALEVQMELQSSSSPMAAERIVGSIDSVVHIVEIKGRMVTFFLESSTSPVSNSSQVFRLRTTGKQNNWMKRPKALRDNSGQIIK